MGGSTGSVVVCVSGAVWCFLLRRGGSVRWECADESVTATSVLPVRFLGSSLPFDSIFCACVASGNIMLAWDVLLVSILLQYLFVTVQTARSIARRTGSVPS